MTSTSSRTLRLLTLLQSHRFWPGTELAGRLGVSERTLRRDIDRLRELGYPVNSSRGTDGGYQLQAGAAMPPLVVDAEEAVAIVVALRSATAGPAAALAEASLSALTKVSQVLPRPLRRQADALRTVEIASPTSTGPPVDAEVLTSVAQAVRDRVRLTFEHTKTSGEVTHRTVEPTHLVTLYRRWYLLAWDLPKADWRTFRLDRMAAARATVHRFRPRDLPGGDPVATVTRAIGHQRDHHRVVASVELPAEQVRHRVGRWCEVSEIGPDRCRLEMDTDDLGWALLALGGLGAEFRVDQPAELRAALVDWSARFSRAAGPPEPA